MPTITGTLQTILNNTAEEGEVEVALCGYGSHIPRMSGIALASRITSDDVVVGSDGTFEFDVIGNDQISPPGTYYTVTVKDDNGDIIQINAYLFLSTQLNYDLNLIDSYDPNQPPQPLPPPILNLLLVLIWADNMIFDGSKSTAFKTILGGDVTQPVFENMAPGNLYTFIIEQDAIGGWDFVWAANVRNASPVAQSPNSQTIQTFVANETGYLDAIGAGTYYP